jgi:hypothetical protein
VPKLLVAVCQSPLKEEIGEKGGTCMRWPYYQTDPLAEQRGCEIEVRVDEIQSRTYAPVTQNDWFHILSIKWPPQ